LKICFNVFHTAGADIPPSSFQKRFRRSMSFMKQLSL
jgi:hypothetical protein